MNYEGLLCGAALQRAKCCKGSVVKRGEQNDMIVKSIDRRLSPNQQHFLNPLSDLTFLNCVCKKKKRKLPYIGEDAVAFVAHASLQTEGQVMAADHDAAAEALLKRLHIWLDT